MSKEYDYRIKIVTNRAGETTYYPQYRRKDFLPRYIAMIPLTIIWIIFLLLFAQRGIFEWVKWAFSTWEDASRVFPFTQTTVGSKEKAMSIIEEKKRMHESILRDEQIKEERKKASKIKSVEYEKM